MLENRLSKEELVKREYPRKEDMRGHFFRDTTAIIHSYPYRRLKHKTQVFFSPKNDHICTRIEHVMHVATVSVTICKALSLDTELAWAISLGHDLGHTPFGHTGEHIVSEIMKDKDGFRHEGYSLRVVDNLINYGKGLNLTYAVRDGILNHCGEVFEKIYKPDFKVKKLSYLEGRMAYPSTWEGIVVRASDRIAYLGRDLEDAIHLGIVRKEDIPPVITKVLGSRNSDKIDTLVRDVIAYTEKEGVVGFSDDVYDAMLTHKEFNYKCIYNSTPLIKYHQFIERIIKTLWNYLSETFDRYGFDTDKYKEEKNMLMDRFGDFLFKMKKFYTEKEKSEANIVLDYIAGMTDDYAIDCVSELFVPGKFDYRQYL